MSDLPRLIQAAKELLASVSFDENGTMIGDKWIGGNGGLISRTTHQKADALRRVLDTFKETPDGKTEEIQPE